MWYSYLQQFFVDHHYPQEGAQSLLKALKQIQCDTDLWQTVCRGVAAYEAGTARTKEEITALLLQIREAASGACVHTEEAELLFFLLCTKHLKTLYLEAGLPAAYYDGVAFDLRCKLIECHEVRDIWGSFVAHWFPRFFAVDRFAIGRLQYELIAVPESYCTEETAHLAGQTAVNIHIPSGPPLRRDEIRASMREAAMRFAQHFPDGNVRFICHSWLLFPGHREMLSESSGIRQFMDEFPQIFGYLDTRNLNLWRIFHTDSFDDLDALPCDTSLQRAYIQWLKAGKCVGGGMGLRYIRL